jgi:predicted O-methyltransferase YrrM
MSVGEQLALEGLLSTIKPRIAIEIGTYKGGSLRRIAAHSAHVHTFDLVSHVDDHYPNVTYHLGDSAIMVPRLLADLEQKGWSVDFVLVDGDHSADGAYRDARAVLSSIVTRHASVAFHDIANEDVREGVRRAIAEQQDLAYVDLSFIVPSGTSSLLGEAWGGLA